MKRWKWIILMGGLAFVLCGCKSSEDGEARILGDWHLGYKNQHCDSCHNLPVEGHSTSDHWACAACHGGNGACNPNGNQSARSHQKTDECLSCHIANHGYSQAMQCAGCHFALLGLDDDCGITPMDGGSDGGGDGGGQDAGDTPADAGGDEGGGPVLSDALVDNCFNWPQDEFSSTNKASVTTSIAEGALAVEFTLQDVDGNPFTLSDLLQTRPVLMVFGAYT
jgi:hypothetical protein